MTAQPRLAFLLETVGLETAHLIQTSQRLFAQPFDAARAAALKTNLDESERADAFAARFGRLQDTLGDKLLPELLRELAEPVGPAIDNLDRAEKLGLLTSADDWLAARKLRNAGELADALNEAHTLVPLLTGFAQTVARFCQARGLA